MTITITPNGEHRLDQSSGTQSGGALDKDDVALSTDLNQLPDAFEAFLEGLTSPISAGQLDNAADYEAAHEDPTASYFIDVTADSGETINDIYFSQSDGSLFDGQVAQYDPGTGLENIYVVGSTDPIYLYSFAGGDILIGSTDSSVDITDPTTLDGSTIVFAYYLEENGTHTGADVWGVTFQPLDHPISGDDTLGEYDDAIDFGDFLYVSTTANLSFKFDTLESGKFLWVAVGDDQNGLLVTGKDLNVDATGNRVSGGNDPSDAVNTSQGGAGATIGINNQLWIPGNEGVFTFVKGFTALGSGPDATGDDVDDIDYNDGGSGNPESYINTIGAGLFISQKQGSPSSSLDMTIKVWEAGGGPSGDIPENLTAEEGTAYIGAEGPPNDGTSGAFEDDHAVNVDTVTIYDASDPMNPITIGTWDADALSGPMENGSLQNGTTVTITGNEIDVDGADEYYLIEWTVYDGTTFNRFTLEADAGKFDVGRVDLTQGLIETEAVGEDVIIHDDGPSAVITDTGIAVVHDESAGQQNAPLVVNIIDTAGDDIAGGDNLNEYFGGVTDGDTLEINGEVVFTYGLANDGILISDLETAIDGFDAITDADIATGDFLVTRLGSTAVLEFGGPIATGLGLLPTYANADNESDILEDNNDDDQAGALPGVFSGGALGWAMSAEPVVSSDSSSYGTDGAGTSVWSLALESDLLGEDVDSGLDALVNGVAYDILLNVEGGIVVGRIDSDDDGDIDGDDVDSGAIAIEISIDQNGYLSVAQNVAIAHVPDTGIDQRDSLDTGVLFAVLTVKDGDLDVDVDQFDISSKVIIEDDGPVGAGLATATLEEDDLVAAAGTPPVLSTGNTYLDDSDANPENWTDVDGWGDGSGTNTSVTLNLQDGITSTGVDAPVSFSLDPAIPEGVYTGTALPDLYSKGEQLTYVVDHGDTATDPDTITAYADYGGGDRVVWTFVVTDNGNGTGTAVFTIYDQLDHAPFGDDIENELLVTDPATDWDNSGDSAVDQIDFTDLLLLKDADNDEVFLGTEFVTYAIQDDIPIIAEDLDGTANPISDGLVDFTTIDGVNLDDFGGTSTNSVTNSLNGLIGTDENDGNNEAGDGTKTYTFASYSTDTSVISGLQSELIEDDTRVVYFTDGDSEGNVIGEYDGNDILYYDIVLNQTANSGAGSYTFTVYQDPPPSVLEFDFEDLPSGQNLHGTIAVDKTDLTEGGLLLFPKGAILDSEGVYTTGSPKSPTTNTSKGGGPVTIGNSNQMFDPGEGHYFIFVDDPVHGSVAGDGLNQNNADDADTVGFDGTIEVGGAEVEIVQVQGNQLATIRVEAFDISLASPVNTSAEARDLITDPEALNGTNEAPTSVAEIDIVSVYVKDANGIVIEAEALSDGGTPTINDADVDIVFNGDGTINVSGLDAGYTVGWETDGVADMWLVQGVIGKYDIGGFNLLEAQPTPDQKFDFTVDITDFDGDVATSNEFSIGIDGTGSFDDDAVTGVSPLP